MANTNYVRDLVEPYVRKALAAEFGVPFEAGTVKLKPGAAREFGAVSTDGTIVACIRTSSGKTASGKSPAGKRESAEAALYYLMLVSAPTRLLVLTDPEFYEILSTALDERLASGIEIKLVQLPQHIQQKVRAKQQVASREVTPS